jgi:integration host factor subunit beta
MNTEQKIMHRSDFIGEFSKRFKQINQRDAEIVIDTLLNAITQALLQNRRVEIRGFGSFSINHRAAHKGRNPRSGMAVNVPAKRNIHFKPGQSLRISVDYGT